MANAEIGSHLKNVRKSLGLKLAEAAKKLGFPNYQTLKSIEDGGREIKAPELLKFSKVYFVSISKLLGEKEIQLGNTFLWRKQPPLEKKKQIEAEISYRCEQYNLLEKLLNLKVKRGRFLDVTMDDISSNSGVDKLSESIHRILALGSRPAFTLQKVLEQDLGIKILFEAIPEGSAVSTYSSEFGAVIVINSNEAPWRRNYDLAHELFHLVTWKVISEKDLKDSSYFTDIEKKADRFASNLLLPENEINKEIEDRINMQDKFTNSDLVDIAQEFGVSTKALLYRMANLRFIRWENADNLAKDQEFAEISRQKRRHEWGEKPMSERFISLAVRCLRKGLISRGKFAEIVSIDRCEIDDFIEDTGLMEQEGTPIEIMAS